MKNINYYGQKITVSDEVAEFWSRIVYGKVLNEEVTSVTWISLGMKFTQCPVCSQTSQPIQPLSKHSFFCGSTNSGRSFQLCLMMTRNCFGFTTFGSIHWNRSARNLV